MSPDELGSLRYEPARRQRRALLDLPSVAPLSAYAASLRAQNRGEVPDFDPLDGGVDAEALFLLEKPGPGTSLTGKRAGSGFISRDNNDRTAMATKRFLEQAGLSRRLTVLWNVIPWWNGTIRVMAAERHAGAAELHRLIGLLPKLRVIVLVGGTAARARPLLADTGLPVLASLHPSPQVAAAMPERWKQIPEQWAAAAAYISSSKAT